MAGIGLLVFAILLPPFALLQCSAQSALGKHPADKVLPAFFSGTNGVSNANNIIQGLNQYGTLPGTNTAVFGAGGASVTASNLATASTNGGVVTINVETNAVRSVVSATDTNSLVVTGSSGPNLDGTYVWETGNSRYYHAALGSYAAFSGAGGNHWSLFNYQDVQEYRLAGTAPNGTAWTVIGGTTAPTSTAFNTVFTIDVSGTRLLDASVNSNKLDAATKSLLDGTVVSNALTAKLDSTNSAILSGLAAGTAGSVAASALTGKATIDIASNAPVFNVKDYGPVGLVGVSNAVYDSPAIAAAYQAWTNAGRGTLYFPAGIYVNTNSFPSGGAEAGGKTPLSCTSDADTALPGRSYTTRFAMVGEQHTEYYYSGTNWAFMFQQGAPHIKNIHFHDLNPGQARGGIWVYGVAGNFIWDNLYFIGFQNTNGAGYVLDDTTYVTLRDIWAQNCYRGHAFAYKIDCTRLSGRADFCTYGVELGYSGSDTTNKYGASSALDISMVINGSDHGMIWGGNSQGRASLYCEGSTNAPVSFGHDPALFGTIAGEANGTGKLALGMADYDSCPTSTNRTSISVFQPGQMDIEWIQTVNFPTSGGLAVWPVLTIATNATVNATKDFRLTYNGNMPVADLSLGSSSYTNYTAKSAIWPNKGMLNKELLVWDYNSDSARRTLLTIGRNQYQPYLWETGWFYDSESQGRFSGTNFFASVSAKSDSTANFYLQLQDMGIRQILGSGSLTTAVISNRLDNTRFINNVRYDATITPGGTTGDRTIHRMYGTVNFAAAATSITVTCIYVTTSSSIFAVVRTADATATIKNVIPGSGSFTINLGAAATAETSVGFFIVNP